MRVPLSPAKHFNNIQIVKWVIPCSSVSEESPAPQSVRSPLILSQWGVPCSSVSEESTDPRSVRSPLILSQWGVPCSSVSEESPAPQSVRSPLPPPKLQSVSSVPATTGGATHALSVLTLSVTWETTRVVNMKHWSKDCGKLCNCCFWGCVRVLPSWQERRGNCRNNTRYNKLTNLIIMCRWICWDATCKASKTKI